MKFNYTSIYGYDGIKIIEIERQQRVSYKYTTKYISFCLGDKQIDHLTFHRSEIVKSRKEGRRERKGYHKVRSALFCLNANTIGPLAMIDKILHKSDKDRRNLIKW